MKGFDYRGRYRYALTFCTREKFSYFMDEIVIRKVAEILRDAADKHQFRVLTCCFMPDHLHVLVEGESPSSDMKKFAADFKQKSGFWFHQVHGKSLWQVNYYDHVLRSDEVTAKIARYILDNPVRKGLVEDYRIYPFSWCDVLGFVGQGFSLAESATLKGCPTQAKECDSVGQGFSLAKMIRNPEGLPYKRQEAGFTLVELIITIVLIGIIASVAAMLILQGVRGYSDEEIRSDLTNQARLGIERMAREIREARDCPDISTMSATEVAFCDVSGKAVGFRITGTELQRRDSTTCSPPSWGPWVALASSVDSGTSSFSYYRRDDTVAGSAALVWTIQVSLTVSRSGESHTHRIRVHPRGFQSASCG